MTCLVELVGLAYVHEDGGRDSRVALHYRKGHRAQLLNVDVRVRLLEQLREPATLRISIQLSQTCGVL